MSFNFLKSGCYFLGTKCQHKSVTFGTLEINPAEDEQGNSLLGQWYFGFCDPKTRNDEILLKIQDIKSVFLNIACRLGLKPVIFTDQFKQALLEEKTICLVADTSALLHGYLEQALRLRGDKPTDITIPDQVYMEVQRQRERHKGDKKPSLEGKTEQKSEGELCLKQRRLRKLQYIAARSIERLKRSRILHYIRPPEAMVRYFGTEISDDNQQQGSERINYHRDRLILEALRHQRQTLPHVPVWLVTGDANFAIQVKLEDFNVGFVRQPELSKVPSFIITSPFIEPYSLIPYHVHVKDFLEECLWEWGILTLQPEGKDKRKIFDISNEKTSQAIQLGIESIEKSVKEEKGFSILEESHSNFSLEAVVKVPKHSPLPSRILKILEMLLKEQVIKEISSGEMSYLKALQWVEATKVSIALTLRGKEVVENWSYLTKTDVKAWYNWILDVKKDIKQLDQQVRLRNLLSESTPPPETDVSLAKKLGTSKPDASSQSMLANAFGLAIRLGGKTWKAEEKRPQEAADLILEKVRSLKDDRISSAVRVDKIFTALLKTTPLSVPTFRIGLVELFESGKIRLSGTVPDSGGNGPVKVRVLIPQQYESTIDLGAGDFLVPSQSSQVIIL